MRKDAVNQSLNRILCITPIIQTLGIPLCYTWSYDLQNPWVVVFQNNTTVLMQCKRVYIFWCFQIIEFKRKSVSKFSKSGQAFDLLATGVLVINSFQNIFNSYISNTCVWPVVFTCICECLLQYYWIICVASPITVGGENDYLQSLAQDFSFQ